jgi:hypothetical protein
MAWLCDRFHLDPARAFALLALLANVLFAGSLHGAASATDAGAARPSALCRPNGVVQPGGPFVPDQQQPADSNGMCCILGCPNAGSDLRAGPAEDQAAIWPPTRANAGEPISLRRRTVVLRPITLASAGPRGPPANAGSL